MVHFLWAEVVQAAEIHTCLCAKYSACAVCRRSIYVLDINVHERPDKHDLQRAQGTPQHQSAVRKWKKPEPWLFIIEELVLQKFLKN